MRLFLKRNRVEGGVDGVATAAFRSDSTNECGRSKRKKAAFLGLRLDMSRRNIFGGHAEMTGGGAVSASPKKSA